jgi:NAD(P)-dependent dehydrogenase (short-subunit alcohol dehydrogenase family)
VKVVVTGHAEGIGAAVAALLTSEGHTVIGASRRTGYNLGTREGIDKLVDLCSRSDVLINNARPNQQFILERVYNLWEGRSDTLIVNVSSMATWHTASTSPGYTAQKAALESYAKWLQIRGNKWPVCTVVRPGYVDTPETERKNVAKMNASCVASVVSFILANYQTYRIQDITFSSL